MDAHIKDRKQKVLVVEANASSRTLLTEQLRVAGFAEVQGVATIKDAIGTLENESVCWVISSLNASESPSAFQLLKLFSRIPALRDVRMSLFVEENELELLPMAFELGLLSYHLKPFTKESVKSQIDNLLADFEQNGWNATTMSSIFLRHLLSKLGQWNELLAFERALLQARPGDFGQMLQLALPMIKSERVEEAKAVLLQVQSLDSSYEKQVKAIQTQHLGGAELKSDAEHVNILNINSVVVVDSDSSVQAELTATLQEMGVGTVKVFSDGRSALEHLQQSQDNDLIIHEWKLPKLAGPLFLQKAKDEAQQAAPFILYSSLVEKSDVPFVREMGVASVMMKPSARADVVRSIVWTIQQERHPTERSTLEFKMRAALDKKDMETAESFAQKLLSDPNLPKGNRLLVQAELAYAKDKFHQARDLAFESLKNSGESIFVLNLLGKTLMQLRDVETALKCFMKAQHLAPQNLERLCQIAEIQAELGQDEASEATLDKLGDMDPDSQMLNETKAKIAITGGDSAAAKSLMGQLKGAENVVSYMNNLAVAMARCGKVDEGISQYQKTLAAIPDNRPDLGAIVRFNLAIAYARAQRLDEAEAEVASLDPKQFPKIAKKSLALLKRIRAAKESGQPLELEKPQAAPSAELSQAPAGGAEEATEASLEEDASIAMQEELNAVMSGTGETRCCYLIYRCSLTNATVSKMLEGEIRFKNRVAIQKQESLGHAS